MHDKDDAPGRQQRLLFRDDEIWTALPESARKDCRALLQELLRETLERQDRRANERQDQA